MTQEDAQKWLTMWGMGTWEDVLAGGERAEKVAYNLIDYIQGQEETLAWRDCSEEQ